jgi:hypothetical protein
MCPVDAVQVDSRQVDAIQVDAASIASMTGERLAAQASKVGACRAEAAAMSSTLCGLREG